MVEGIWQFFRIRKLKLGEWLVRVQLDSYWRALAFYEPTRTWQMLHRIIFAATKRHLPIIVNSDSTFQRTRWVFFWNSCVLLLLSGWSLLSVKLAVNAMLTQLFLRFIFNFIFELYHAIAFLQSTVNAWYVLKFCVLFFLPWNGIKGRNQKFKNIWKILNIIFHSRF